jgi:hypothetical protein
MLLVSRVGQGADRLCQWEVVGKMKFAEIVTMLTSRRYRQHGFIDNYCYFIKIKEIKASDSHTIRGFLCI